MESVLLPFLEPLPSDVDSDLRCRAVQLLVHLIPSASTDHACSMLAILSQVGVAPAAGVCRWLCCVYM